MFAAEYAVRRHVLPQAERARHPRRGTGLLRGVPHGFRGSGPWIRSRYFPLLARCRGRVPRRRPVTAQRFLSDAEHLARILPASAHVLNVCADRYHFTVGFAACLMTGRVSLLPSTHTPEVIGQLSRFAPDVFCLTDDRRCDIDLPKIYFPEEASAAPLRRRARAANSGSPDSPPSCSLPDRPARRCPTTRPGDGWSRCVRDGAPRLGLLDGRTHTLIGTVPAQHMYGFESTVLLALAERQRLQRGAAVLSGGYRGGHRSGAAAPGAGHHPDSPAHAWSHRKSNCRRWISSSRRPRRCLRIWRARSKRNSAPPCWKSTAPRRPGRSPCGARPHRPPGGSGRTFV